MNQALRRVRDRENKRLRKAGRGGMPYIKALRVIDLICMAECCCECDPEKPQKHCVACEIYEVVHAALGCCKGCPVAKRGREKLRVGERHK